MSGSTKLFAEAFLSKVRDFVARIETGENKAKVRIPKWLRDNIKEFDKPNPENPKETLADRFYLDFRNGLVHEGRIKNLGQFSYEDEEIVSLKSGVMLINPRLLLIEMKRALKIYFKKLHNDPDIFRKFRENFMKDFEEEVNRAKTI